MARSKFKLDHPGIGEILLSAAVAVEVSEMAADVASRIDETAGGETIPVYTDDYTTDRAASSVTLAHPAGLAVEAKRGTLARAAHAAGLEVRSKVAS